MSARTDYHAVQYLTPTDYQTIEPGTDFVEPTAWNFNLHPDA